MISARPVSRHSGALEALAVLLPEQTACEVQGGRTTLAIRLEGLTAAQVQERLRAEGVEVSLEFAAGIQLDVVQKLKHREIAIEVRR
jgi:hypothetical protein